MACTLDIPFGCIPRSKIAGPKDVSLFFKNTDKSDKNALQRLVPIYIPTITRACYTKILKGGCLCAHELNRSLTRFSLQASLNLHHSITCFQMPMVSSFPDDNTLGKQILNLINGNKLIYTVHLHSNE